MTRDVISHDSSKLREIHARARQYDSRVEHLWTYCQVVSAMMMSIAHGSNDVANAVGPWAAVYETYKAGAVATTSPTPVWFLIVAGLLLGLGFWVYGYNIMRALGNKITQMSPTRGFSIELGAAVTVMLASRLALPVSTTQCLVGSSMGVALMNYDLGAVNWRQLGFIFMGWVRCFPRRSFTMAYTDMEPGAYAPLCGTHCWAPLCDGSQRAEFLDIDRCGGKRGMRRNNLSNTLFKSFYAFQLSDCPSFTQREFNRGAARLC